MDIMKHALIIEDQRPVRESLGELLKLAGFEVKLIGDGHAGLEEAQATRYDLLTVDLNMPSLDGLSLIESLVSAEGPNQKTPVVVISAYLSSETEDTLRELGVIECLSKPFEADLLLDLVKNALQ
jgi:DNA-binding response OmpR family regulator